MSHRVDDKQARRAERLRLEEQARRGQQRQRTVRRAGYGAVGLIAATLVTVAVVLGGGNGSASAGPGTASGGGGGSGVAIGAVAPAFALTDVLSGKQVTLRSLAGHKTLLFFSEGVGCQACMVQAADLQNNRTLAGAGIKLVSITTDPRGDLAQAASQYGIRAPMLADPTTTMSAAYGMLAQGGMQHGGQDGHAFMLLDAKGTVLWHQAYPQMYVQPSQLLADMGSKA